MRRGLVGDGVAQLDDLAAQGRQLLLERLDHLLLLVDDLRQLGVLALDRVDGSLARHRDGESRFGARYDMEVDAVFVLALSCALWSRGVAGPWVLLAGLWRYLFVVIPLIVPSRGGEAPRSLLYRSAYSVMVGCFLVALVAPPDVAPAIALVGTVVLSASFLRSFWYRYRPPTTA